MFRLKLAATVIGFVLIYLGVEESRLASAAKPEPQTITCEQLASKGPGDNAHIVLTDFLMRDDSFVYESKRTSKDRWNKIWVPLAVPDADFAAKIQALMGPDGKLTGPVPAPTNIRVLLKSGKVENLQELESLAAQDTISGVVTNTIESLGAKERQILEESYPGIDFTSCYILDHDRKPAGAGKVAGMIGGGAVLALAGAAWMLAGRRS